MPLGFAVVGVVCDRLGLTATMVVASAVGVVWAVVTAALPSVRRLRHEPDRASGHRTPHPPTDPSPAPAPLA